MTKQDYKTLLKLRIKELEEKTTGVDHTWVYYILKGRLEAYEYVLDELDVIEEEPQ